MRVSKFGKLAVALSITVLAFFLDISMVNSGWSRVLSGDRLPTYGLLAGTILVPLFPVALAAVLWRALGNLQLARVQEQTLARLYPGLVTFTASMAFGDLAVRLNYLRRFGTPIRRGTPITIAFGPREVTFWRGGERLDRVLDIPIAQVMSVEVSIISQKIRAGLFMRLNRATHAVALTIQGPHGPMLLEMRPVSTEGTNPMTESEVQVIVGYIQRALTQAARLR
jgi:hypothetical protein